MLTNGEDQASWTSTFMQNSALIPAPVFQKPVEPASPLKRKHAPVVSHMYQIIFDSIHNIPIKNQVLVAASKSNLEIVCVLGMSLFDLESGIFFGKTWTSSSIQLVKNIDEDSSEDSSSSDSEASDGIDKQRANFIGNKLVLRLKNQCVYLHTHLQSRHILAAVEIILQVGNDRFSAGWTPLYLFNNARGGLRFNGDLVPEPNDTLKTSQLFNGSPRVLPFISSTLLESSDIINTLNPIAGCILKYYLLPRPDIRKKSCLWPENTFIGSGDRIPGIRSISVRTIEAPVPTKITLTNIEITVPPSVAVFEEKLLDKVRDAYFEEYPEAATIDSDGNIVCPVVLERRLHCGMHNTFGYIHPPRIVTLDPQEEDETLGKKLLFNGNILLENHMESSEKVVLAFMVDYRILIRVKGIDLDNIKGEFRKLLERLNLIKIDKNIDDPTFGIEKIVSVGWKFIRPEGISNIQLPLELNFLLDGVTVPNPFSKIIYRSFQFQYRDEDEEFSLKNATKVIPLGISLNLNDASMNITSVPPTPTLAKVHLVHVQEPTIEKVEVKQASAIELKEEVEQELKEVEPLPKPTNFQPIPEVLTRTKSQLTRMEKARLMSAGFETIYDENGELPIENSNAIEIPDLNLELSDYRSNRITIQFMGVSFNENFKSKRGGIVPNSVTFSSQFYTFRFTSTERAKLYLGDMPPTYPVQHEREHFHQRGWSTTSNMANSELKQWPGILYPYRPDGAPNFDIPGLKMKFEVDANSSVPMPNIRYGSTAFPYYMMKKRLFIDLWDGDTLLYLGTATVDLARALRQGKNSVSFEDDVDINYFEYSDGANNHIRRSSSVNSQLSSVEQNTVENWGMLHLRITNVGINVPKMKDDQQYILKINDAVVYDFHHTIKTRLPTKTISKKMASLDSELKAHLLKSYDERMQLRQAMEEKKQVKALEITGKVAEDVDGQPAVDRNLGAEIEMTIDLYPYERSRAERQSDLEIIQIYREKQKKETLAAKIREQITTEQFIECSFGQAQFFEFVFQNPYDYDQNFEFFWTNEDLRVVCNQKEWQFHRKSLNFLGLKKIETDMFKEVNQECYQVFLHGNESINIPFVYQCFKNNYSISNFFKSNEVGKNSGLLTITFTNAKKIPVAYLDLILKHINFYVDNSIQLFHCENELVQKTLMVPLSEKLTFNRKDKVSVFIGDDSQSDRHLYVKCSNSDIICCVDAVRDPNYRELRFKHRLGGAPDHSNVYFIFYEDQYCTVLTEIWRICIHTIYRLDVNCIYGQSNSASVILRGESSSRQFICSSSSPNEISLPNPGPFTIHANALYEIPFLVKSKQDSSRVIVNVVDFESHQLLGSWLIHTHLTLPKITKVFEIQLQKGRPSSKRVSFTNPYNHSIILYLSSDRPDLLEFKNEILNLKARETFYIGLRFASCYLNSTEIFIFLNNEKDRVEECLLVNVSYVD